MGKNIRLGVFETNSSSSHSISIRPENEVGNRLNTTPESNIEAAVERWAENYCISEDQVWEYLEKCHNFKKSDKGNVRLLNGGEYGWGYDVIDYTSGKLNYIFTYIVSTSSKERLEDDERYKMLKKVVKDMTGLEIFPDYFNEIAVMDNCYYYEQELIYFINNNSLERFQGRSTSWDGEVSKCTEVDAWSYNIYIDHQSLYLLKEYFEDEEKLKELIFNQGYEIYIDNDNH